MLIHISIKDFAIVDDLSLDFKSGMTVLTGETGAGKSILIDALNYALGARADASMVRHGCARADISVSFSLAQIPQAHTWLTNAELNNEDKECILRRTIQQDGRSKHFINGQLVTQTQIKTLAQELINIHGQHENQRLLDRDEQQILLDNFAHHEALLKDVKIQYQNWLATQAEINTLQKTGSVDSQIALLRYQVEELEKLATTATEEAELTIEHKKLAQAERLIHDCSQARTALSEGESNVLDLLGASLKNLHTLETLDLSFKKIVSLLEEAKIQASEANDELETAAAHIEINPERLLEVEQRLTLLNDMARKYKVPAKDLLALQARLQSALNTLENADKQLIILEEKLKALAENYKKAAAKLSASRQKTAEIFNQEVTAHIQNLGMPQGIFSLQFEPLDKFSSSGAERIEFLISPNPGQPLKPLHKIASGGELSRISLAIHVITAQVDNTPSLVFDEVDVGISGGTAEIVGRLLRQLAQKTQVICITHLAQVAAQGNQHLKISKTVAEGQTRSHIIELSKTQQIEEIARLLGGINITDKTREHAKEMLEI
jgi:DNA repair protein RecN (Recombination protein N)